MSKTCFFNPRLAISCLAALAISCLTSRAVDPASFGPPLQFTDGGRSVVKAAGTLVLPINDADQNDSGADFLAPLGIHTPNGASWDIVTADHDSKLIRIRQQAVGGGDTYTNVDITAANSPADLVVADVNGDGKLDLVTCEAGQFVVRLNTSDSGTPGALSFGAPVSYSPGDDENSQPLSLTKICVADVDHDQLADLVGVGTATVSGFSKIQMVVLRNTLGQLDAFAPPVLATAYGSADFLIAANLTRNNVPPGGGTALDWFPEIVVGANHAGNGTASGRLVTFLNRGDGTFGSDDGATPSAERPQETIFGLHLHALALGDLDQDGNRDAVVEATNSASPAQTFVKVYGGNGAGKFNAWSASAYIGDNAGATEFQGDVVLADFDGNNAPDIAVTDPLAAQPGVMVLTIDPAAASHNFFGASYPYPNEARFATGAGARALTITDHNIDNKFDLVVANDDSNQLSILDNGGTGGGGGGDPIPDGRVVQFGTINDADEGDLVEVPVLRGKDSTGQVLVFFNFGGTALQSFGGANKNADYELVDPPAGLPLTFADGEHRKTLTIRTLTNPTAEPKDTIELTILEPVGDAEVGDPAMATIHILDGKPAILKTPSALSLKAANVVKPIPVTLPPDVKVAGRTGSDWTFSLSQTLPKGAQNPRVRVQWSPNKAIWFDANLDLQRGKGATWSLLTRHPLFPCSKAFFRAVTSVDGYPDVFSAPTAAFAIVAGPELALNASAKSDSDASGDTVHLNEVITYHLTAANVSTEADANNAVLTVPIPAHTTFLNGTNVFGPLREIKDRKGRTTAVEWTFPSIPKSTINFTEDLLVQVDSAGMFSTKDPTKGFGVVITAKGYTLSAKSQGITAAPVLREKMETQILGSLKLSASSSPSTVDPGGLITYHLDAQNESAEALVNAVVLSEIPAGTELATVYTFDGNGNADATSPPLANPGPLTNPAIIYRKTGTVAKFELGIFPTQELRILKPIASAKAGRVVNLANLSAGTIKTLIDDGFIEPAAVRWTMPLIPGKAPGVSNSRRVSLTVRVPYDAPTLDANGQPVVIVNDDYDFIVPGSNPPSTQISALYRNKPKPLTVAVNNVVPAVKPHLYLAKSAANEQALNNPNFHGNGYSSGTGRSNIATAVSGHGIDFELTYRNDVDANGDGADAHNIVLHDVIPAGLKLRGFFKQDVNDTGYGQMFAEQFTFYDKNGVIIPGVDPNTNVPNMDRVASMDIRLGSVSNLSTVPKGTHGSVRYTCEAVAPAPAVIHVLGGFEPGQGLSGKKQGFYLSTSDQLAPVPGFPDDFVVWVVSDVTWDFPPPEIAVNDSQPFDVVPFDFTFTQNGDVTASNTMLAFGVPPGVTFLTGNFTPHSGAVVTLDRDTHQVADGTTARDFTPVFVGESGTITTTQNGAQVQLALGNIAGHTTHTVRVWFQLNGPALDPAIKSGGLRYEPLTPHLTGSYQPAPSVRERGLLGVRATAPTLTVQAAAGGSNPMRAHELNPPKLGIGRTAPFAVTKGSQFIYTITFANFGDTAATNVDVGMQIPYRADFVSATNGVISQLVPGTGTVPVGNGTAYTTTPRAGKQLTAAGGSLHPGPNIVTWHFANLPPQSTGRIELTVKCDDRFADEPIQDHSLYVSAENTGLVHIAADDITTWILGKSLTESKLQAAQSFFQHAGVTLTPELAPAISEIAKSLTSQSQIHALAALDSFQIAASGAKIIPLGKDQVMVIAHVVSQGAGNVFPLAGNQSLIVSQGGGNVVSQGGGNVVSQGAGNVVAQGAGNAISIGGLAGLGTKDCAYLLDNIPAIVSQGGGNVVAAGGGNLISNDGGSLLSNHAGGGIIGNIGLAATSLIKADGGRIVSQGGGNIVAAGGGNVISSDGASLISEDAGSLISSDGGGLTVSNRGGSGIVAAGGGN